MKTTIIINLFGGQGSGKSTTMAGIFHYLKNANIDCEMVTEFAKELVWESRNDTFKDELYIFAKQNHRLFRCNGKVDVIITDRPILMTSVYNRVYGNQNDVKWNKSLDCIVKETFDKYNNYNFYLKRVKPYNPNGRNETEEKAKLFDKKFLSFLNENNIKYKTVNGDRFASEEISKYILERLKNK